MATYPTSKPVLTSPYEDWRNKVPAKTGGDSEARAAQRTALPPGESPPTDKEGVEEEVEKKLRGGKAEDEHSGSKKRKEEDDDDEKATIKMKKGSNED